MYGRVTPLNFMCDLIAVLRYSPPWRDEREISSANASIAAGFHRSATVLSNILQSARAFEEAQIFQTVLINDWELS